MARYGADGRCLMRVLQEQLDDPAAARTAAAARSAPAPRFADPPDPRLVELAGRHLRSRPIELEVKKMAPDAHGTMRKIAEDARIEPGWALARFGDGGWWPAVARGLSDGTFDEEVVQALADIVRAQVPSARWMCAVPSARLGDTLDGLARRVAEALGLPCPALVAAHRAAPAAAGDGERGQPGGERPRSVPGHRDAAARHRRAARRPPQLGLDARDGRRPAAARGRRAGRAAGARHVALTLLNAS